jgi:hypothetical protein
VTAVAFNALTLDFAQVFQHICHAWIYSTKSLSEDPLNAVVGLPLMLKSDSK